MEWYLRVIKDHYCDFNARAGRQEFWMFTLVNVIIALVVGVVLGLLHLQALAGLYSLAVLLPGLGVTVRRLHDLGKPGWFIFIGAIPIVGGLYLIYLLAQPGESDSNAYGEKPSFAE